MSKKGGVARMPHCVPPFPFPFSYNPPPFPSLSVGTPLWSLREPLPLPGVVSRDAFTYHLSIIPSWEKKVSSKMKGII